MPANTITGVETDPTSRSAPTICVVGSVNLDLVVAAPRLPSPGETVTKGVLGRYPGGKGANQALAARRQGAEVTLIAAVGADEFADSALELVHRDGVDLSRLITVEHEPTGVALIVVDANGENQIAVAPGANHALSPDHVKAQGFDAVLCQLEIPDSVIIEAADQASGLFCVNAAPARSLPQPVIDRADLVIVNQVEHQALGDQLASFTGVLVTTLGGEGAEVRQGGAPLTKVGAPQVEVVDTVGAGDAFCGTLVVGLAGGLDIDQAMLRACWAGALATTRPGAQPSLPTMEEVDRLSGH